MRERILYLPEAFVIEPRLYYHPALRLLSLDLDNQMADHEKHEIGEDDLDQVGDIENKDALTDWKNEPKLSDLKADYDEAKSGHDAQVAKIDRWLDNLNITGSAKITTGKNQSSIQPKLIRKHAEWRYSSLSQPFLSTDDLYNADPVSFEDKDSAVQNGLLLNHQFNNQLQKIKFINDYVRTAVDEGTVIVRTGWDFQEDMKKFTVPVYEMYPSEDPAAARRHQEVGAMAQNDPEQFEMLPEELKEAFNFSMQTGQLHEAIEVGEEEQEEFTTTVNRPTIEVCDNRNVIVDPTCKGDMTKAEFVIYSFETSKSSLEKEGKYTNIDQISTTANSVLSTPDHDSDNDDTFAFKDDARKKFVAYEYWGYYDIDGSGKVKPIVATWVGDVLIRMEENPFPNKKIPFVTVPYLPIRRSIYGEPDGVLIEDNQKIVGAVTRGMVDLLGKSANGQMASRKDALDVTNKRKFDAGEDYEFNASSDPRTAFHQHVYPEFPNSASIMLNMQYADADSLTGIKAFNSGITGAALGESTGLGKSALDAAAKREFDILLRLGEGIRQIGLMIASMNGEFLSEEETVRITAEEFVTIRRDQLSENFDLRLTISTPEADEQKAKELAFMLQTLGPQSPPDLRKLILAEIATLRKMPEFARKLAKFEPKPDPLMVKKQELEVALLEAQVANERSKGIENQAKAQLDQAKAKALGSKSDLDDLEYVEKESGTTQARALELAGEQAASNIERDLVNGALNERLEDKKQTKTAE